MTLTAIIPQLRTTDLEASIDFYVNRMGFELAFRYEDFYAGIRSGACQFHLKHVDEPDPSIAFVRAGDHIHLYVETNTVAADQARLRAAGAKIVKPLATTPWGTQEFYVADDQGHVLCFGQPA